MKQQEHATNPINCCLKQVNISSFRPSKNIENICTRGVERSTFAYELSLYIMPRRIITLHCFSTKVVI